MYFNYEELKKQNSKRTRKGLKPEDRKTDKNTQKKKCAFFIFKLANFCVSSVVLHLI